MYFLRTYKGILWNSITKCVDFFKKESIIYCVLPFLKVTFLWLLKKRMYQNPNLLYHFTKEQQLNYCFKEQQLNHCFYEVMF